MINFSSFYSISHAQLQRWSKRKYPLSFDFCVVDLKVCKHCIIYALNFIYQQSAHTVLTNLCDMQIKFKWLIEICFPYCLYFHIQCHIDMETGNSHIFVEWCGRIFGWQLFNMNMLREVARKMLLFCCNKLR